MLRLVPLLLLLVVASRAREPIEQVEPIDLLADLPGWEYVTPDPQAKLADVCSLKPDGVLAVAGKPNGYLVITSGGRAHGVQADYLLSVEWRWTDKPGNGGILVHINSGPLDRNLWPRCYQIQTKHKSVGDLLPMVDAKFAEPLSTPPDAKPALLSHSAPDSEKPVGEWNSCVITCRGDTIEVIINDVLQNKVTGCSIRAGQIGFQLEGAPFELRNVTVTP